MAFLVTEGTEKQARQSLFSKCLKVPNGLLDHHNGDLDGGKERECQGRGQTMSAAWSWASVKHGGESAVCAWGGEGPGGLSRG